MVVEALDIMQTQQIEDLQEDVQELENKINLAVTDVNQITGKMNNVISDLENLHECLMGPPGNQYSPSGTVDNDGLLKRIDELYAVFWDHIHMPPFSQSSQGFNSSHPPFQGSSNQQPTHATPVPNSLATVTQSNVVPYDENSTPPFPAAGRSHAAVTGDYTPTPSKVAIVLKTSSERRARHLARKIQGQITEEDRVHK